ncbi:hypothetical protein D9M70_479720 [compost metagenome]
MEEHGDIEAAEVENLLAGRIGEHGDEVRRLPLAGGDADDVGGAVARRKLYDTETVTAGDETKRFSVDGDRTGIARSIGCGNVAFMDPYCIRHRKSPDQTKWCGL